MNCSREKPPARVAPDRVGTTLLELLLILTITSAVMGLVGMLLQQMLRADRALRSTANTVSHVARLESLFRHDAWSAATSELVPGEHSSKLLLDSPEGPRVEYEARGNLLHRKVFRHDRLALQDLFAFPHGSTVVLERVPPGQVTVRIQVGRTPADQPPLRGFEPPPRVFRIAVTLGRNTRPAHAGATP